jgi:hypothetical protein
MTWAVAAGARKSKGCWVGLSCELRRVFVLRKQTGSAPARMARCADKNRFRRR